jgi:predicted ABC-type ATPase
MTEPKPLLIILAGPNGAGKSTFYESYLAELLLPFLNADVLSRKTGIDPYAAAREIAAIRDHFVRLKRSFVFETVLSDPVGEKVAFAANAAEAGFDVHLIFVGIKTAALSKQRVRDRVAIGGHDVPVGKLDARYNRTLDNLERAIAQLPLVTIYDNSEYRTPFRFVAEFRNGKLDRKGEPPVPSWVRRFLK